MCGGWESIEQRFQHDAQHLFRIRHFAQPLLQFMHGKKTIELRLLTGLSVRRVG